MFTFAKDICFHGDIGDVSLPYEYHTHSGKVVAIYVASNCCYTFSVVTVDLQ